MAENSINFPQMDQDLADIRREHTEFQNELGELLTKVGQYKLTWTGAAREAWDRVEQEWNEASQLMAAKLQDSEKYLITSTQKMRDDENTNVQRLGA